MSESLTASAAPALQPADFLPYYEMAANRGADPILLEALGLIEKDPGIPHPGFAVDLGCGTGKDTVELLGRGWRVKAIDYCQQGIDKLLERPEAAARKNRLRTQVASFSTATWQRCDLMVALLSLPYCPAGEFFPVWQKVVRSLKPGGYLVCHLFGDKEKWPGAENARHHSAEQVEALLNGLEVIKLVDDHNSDKEYHVYSIIARRRKSPPRRNRYASDNRHRP